MSTPAWVPCQFCPEYWCTIHDMHAFECECPAVEEWTRDPYSEGNDAAEVAEILADVEVPAAPIHLELDPEVDPTAAEIEACPSMSARCRKDKGKTSIKALRFVRRTCPCEACAGHRQRLRGAKG